MFFGRNITFWQKETVSAKLDTVLIFILDLKKLSKHHIFAKAGFLCPGHLKLRHHTLTHLLKLREAEDDLTDGN